MILLSSEKLNQLNTQLCSIGGQLHHYYVQLSSGKASGALHFSVYAGQLDQWSLMISSLLADAGELATVTQMFPYWTQTNLQSTLTSLGKIKGYMAKHLEPFNHGGAWRMKDARGLQLNRADTAALASLIGAELSQ